MKQALREEFLKLRKTITKEEIKSRSKLMEKKLFAFVAFSESKNVMFFASFGREPFTHNMITKALRTKIVSIPKIFGENLLPCKINSTKDFAMGPYGAPEPSTEKFFSVKKIDLVIVPALAFTNTGERLGYGKGYFDRFLKKTNAYRIGLCFDEFVVKKLPTNSLDIGVDAVVTDKRVIVVNKYIPKGKKDVSNEKVSKIKK